MRHVYDKKLVIDHNQSSHK